MKKFALVFALLGFSSPSYAACGSGTVSYVWTYVGPTTSSLMAIINGTACVVNGNQNAVTSAAAILAQAMAGSATGMKGFLYKEPDFPNIGAAIQY